MGPSSVGLMDLLVLPYKPTCSDTEQNLIFPSGNLPCAMSDLAGVAV